MSKKILTFEIKEKSLHLNDTIKHSCRIYMSLACDVMCFHAFYTNKLDVYYRGDKCTVSRETMKEIHFVYNGFHAVIKRLAISLVSL